MRESLPCTSSKTLFLSEGSEANITQDGNGNYILSESQNSGTPETRNPGSPVCQQEPYNAKHTDQAAIDAKDVGASAQRGEDESRCRKGCAEKDSDCRGSDAENSSRRKSCSEGCGRQREDGDEISNIGHRNTDQQQERTKFAETVGQRIILERTYENNGTEGREKKRQQGNTSEHRRTRDRKSNSDKDGNRSVKEKSEAKNARKGLGKKDSRKDPGPENATQENRRRFAKVSGKQSDSSTTRQTVRRYRPEKIAQTPERSPQPENVTRNTRSRSAEENRDKTADKKVDRKGNHSELGNRGTGEKDSPPRLHESKENRKISTEIGVDYYVGEYNTRQEEEYVTNITSVGETKSSRNTVRKVLNRVKDKFSRK